MSRKITIKRCVFQCSILWNHSYSWGPVFMDCQNFAGLWGRNFMGNRFVASQYKTIRYFVWGNVNSWLRVTQEIHKHLSHMNNEEFTVSVLYLQARATSVTRCYLPGHTEIFYTCIIYCIMFHFHFMITRLRRSQGCRRYSDLINELTY